MIRTQLGCDNMSFCKEMRIYRRNKVFLPKYIFCTGSQAEKFHFEAVAVNFIHLKIQYLIRV